MKEHGEKSWKLVAMSDGLADKTEAQCLDRCSKVINPKIEKGSWTDEVFFFFFYLEKVVILKISTFQDDRKVIELVAKPGAKKWTFIAQQLSGRIGKQCRERWHKHLNPVINKSAWSIAEDRFGTCHKS